MMTTSKITIGKHIYELGEITAMEELRCQAAYRSSWKQQHGISDTVSQEAERLASCAAMIKSIDDKQVTPLEAFESILSLPKRESDQLKVHYMQINELENFFEVLAQLRKSIDSGSSSKNTEDSAGEPAKGLPKTS